MTEFYDNMAATTASLIAKFGKDVTVRRTTAGTYDAVTETTTGAVSTDTVTKGIEQTIKSELIDGTRIKTGDRLFVLGNSFAPTVDDDVLIGAVAWSIINVRPVSPAGTDLVYFVQVRK